MAAKNCVFSSTRAVYRQSILQSPTRKRTNSEVHDTSQPRKAFGDLDDTVDSDTSIEIFEGNLFSGKKKLKGCKGLVWEATQALYSRETVPAESASFSYQTGKRKLTKARRATSGPSSWLSFLPFSSSKTTKHDYEFMLTLIHDLVVPPPTNSANLSPKSPQLAQADPHEMLASYAQTCSAKHLSLSTLLQEPDIAGHTAIY
ncbi:uncharacterized protein F5891DRAFT_1185185 [Suillus fuscotomentosus]|uniref:Uncharacterized protein n=1 Tax=Suillus fuscotomentosus TaxID=1912939 RepID=A0AAD4HQA1_9AGAM|nr:uncharacterized protein F5891DRAFT_1185185 [Suillus fuscotomentosus]KAG1903569.1 hypothetical protein F5891DRAFT_1185185 [Suillus fuscotomentosus]